MILNFIGQAILALLAFVMVAAFPFTEFARGMATNPANLPRSRGGCVISILGIALLVLLVTGA